MPLRRDPLVAGVSAFPAELPSARLRLRLLHAPSAAWVSDPEGTLDIACQGTFLRRYRQGSGQADFLFCGRCGVLVAVACDSEDGTMRAAINRNAFDSRELLGGEVVASPQRLSPDEKRARWLQLWAPAQLSLG